MHACLVKMREEWTCHCHITQRIKLKYSSPSAIHQVFQLNSNIFFLYLSFSFFKFEHITALNLIVFVKENFFVFHWFVQHVFQLNWELNVPHSKKCI